MEKEEKLLKELISIKSPSDDENEVCNFVFNFLQKNGFRVVKNPVDKNGFNVIATTGTPKIYLAAHLDTVVPFINFKETKTHIFGRGACDTKGCAASMITAVIECKNQGLDNFGLIFTVGEENDFRGAKKIIESKIPIPFIIVGEPTSLKIVNGHFGILTVKLSAKGKAAHSSRPEKGINAIDILLKTIEKVKEIKIHPQSLISLVKISGGAADNIIPEKAEAIFSFRISPEDNQKYFEIIKSLSPKEVKVEKTGGLNSIYTIVPEKLSFIKERITVKYCTELSFFKNGIVFGPGDIGFAHGDKEQISKKELAEAVKIYSDIIKKFATNI